MGGSQSDCLMERGLSGTWALGPVLPPLLSESALAHFQAKLLETIRGALPVSGCR